MFRSKKLQLSILSLTLSTQVTASSDPFDLSIEELMSLPISITSKREENLSKAPGIITVISKQDIKAFGARNLHDVMRLVPGVQQVYPQFGHRSSVAVRGQIAGAVDKYFLILLNGKPLRDPILQGIDSPVFEGIPLSLVEKLEIIRGPGSVIYGSNAVAGVMNIITSNDEIAKSNSVSATYGSFETKINEIVLNTKLSSDSSLTGALRTYETTGWKLGFTDTSNTTSSFRNKNSSWGGFLEFNYGDFTANYFKADTKEKQTLSVATIATATERPSDKEFFSLDYTRQLNSQWKLQSGISSNTSNVSGSTEYDAEDSVVELSVHGDYQNYQLDFGLNYRRNILKTTKNEKVSNVYYKSLYSQLSYNINDNFDAVAGLQLVDPQISKVQLSPRLSLISNFKSGLGTKIMYSKAYSSPTGVELSLDLPGLFQGDPTLVPTTIDNFDVQVSYQKENLYSALSFFHSIYKNVIELEEVTTGTPLPKVFKNAKEIDYTGFEWEVKYDISSKLKLNGSYNYQVSIDANNQINSSLLSKTMVKTGFIYRRSTDLTVSLFNTYFSRPTNRTPITNKYNKVEKAYSHMSFNLSYNVQTFFNTKNNLKFKFFIDNLLNNEAIFLPDPTLSNLNTMPKVSKRSYYAGLDLSF